MKIHKLGDTNMEKMRAALIEEIDLCDNFLRYHYRYLNKRHLPFLYKDDVSSSSEGTAQDTTTRRQNQSSLQSRSSFLDPKRLRDQKRESYRSTLFGQGQASQKAQEKRQTIALQLEKPTSWKRSSMGSKPHVGMVEMLAIQKYENYIKKLAFNFSKIEKRIREKQMLDCTIKDRFTKMSARILKEIQKAYELHTWDAMADLENHMTTQGEQLTTKPGAVETSKSNKEEYQLSHFDKIRQAVDDALHVQVVKEQKEFVLSALKNQMQQAVAQVEKDTMGQQPKQVKEFMIAESSLNRNSVSLNTQSEPIQFHKDSFEHRLGDSPLQRTMDRTLQKGPNIVFGRQKGSIPEESHRTGLADMSQPMLRKKMPSTKDGRFIHPQWVDQPVEEQHILSSDTQRAILREKFRTSTMQYQGADKKFDLTYRSKNDFSRFMAQQQILENTALFRILDKEPIFETKMRLGQVNKMQDTDETLEEWRGLNVAMYSQMQLERLDYKIKLLLEQECHNDSQEDMESDRRRSSLYGTSQLSSIGNKQKNWLKYRDINTLEIPLGDRLKNYTTINTSQHKFRKYKQQVIRDVVKGRFSRIKEVKKILGCSELTTRGAATISSRTPVTAFDRGSSSFIKSKGSNVNHFSQEGIHEWDFVRLYKHFKKELKSRDMLDEESIQSSDFIGYDKFGNRKCKVLEALKKKSLRPRDNLDFKRGEISLGEQRVYDKLKKVRNGIVPSQMLDSDGNLLNIDSLVDSAFNSDGYKRWEDYKFKLKQPQMSQCSQEQFLLYDAERSLDHLRNFDSKRDLEFYENAEVSHRESHDQFSDFNESGSSFSSEYSLVKKQPEPPSRPARFNPDDYKKLAFYKILQGVLIPMPQGEMEKGRFSITNMITVAQQIMRDYQATRQKKLSYNFLDDVCMIYQQALGATQFELLNSIQVAGHLHWKNYHLSMAQLNSLAVTIPYILNLRYINLENVGMQDQQAAYVVKACKKLSKIKMLYFGQNQIGRKFAFEMRDDNLQSKITELSLQNMKHAGVFIVLVLDRLQQYKSIQMLDLEAIPMCNPAVVSLGKTLNKVTCPLLSLNLEGCFKNTTTLAPRSLFSALLTNTSLRTLNLANNNFYSSDNTIGSWIGRVLLFNSTLAHLNLTNCKLKFEEILFITLIVSKNTTFMGLHLGYNNLNCYQKEFLVVALNPTINYCYRTLEERMENLVQGPHHREELPAYSMFLNFREDFILQRVRFNLKTPLDKPMEIPLEQELDEAEAEEQGFPRKREPQFKVEQFQVWQEVSDFSKTCLECRHTYCSTSVQRKSEILDAAESMEHLRAHLNMDQIQNPKLADGQFLDKGSAKFEHFSNLALKLMPIQESKKESPRDDHSASARSKDIFGLRDKIAKDQQDYSDKLMSLRNQGAEAATNQSTVNIGGISAINSNKLSILSSQEEGIISKRLKLGKSDKMVSPLAHSSQLTSPKSEKLGKHYDFRKFQAVQNVIPVTMTRRQTEDKRNHNLKRAFDNNSILFSSRICAAPIVVKDLVKKIWPCDNEGEDAQKLLSMSLDSKKMKQQDNSIKDMEFRNDLMDFVDSSEGEHNDLIYNLDDVDDGSSESKYGFQMKKKMGSKLNSLENSKDSIDFSPPSQVSSQRDQKHGLQRQNTQKKRPKTQQQRQRGVPNPKQTDRIEEQLSELPTEEDQPEQKNVLSQGQFLNSRLEAHAQEPEKLAIRCKTMGKLNPATIQEGHRTQVLGQIKSTAEQDRIFNITADHPDLISSHKQHGTNVQSINDQTVLSNDKLVTSTQMNSDTRASTQLVTSNQFKFLHETQNSGHGEYGLKSHLQSQIPSRNDNDQYAQINPILSHDSRGKYQNGTLSGEDKPRKPSKISKKSSRQAGKKIRLKSRRHLPLSVEPEDLKTLQEIKKDMRKETKEQKKEARAVKKEELRQKRIAQEQLELKKEMLEAHRQMTLKAKKKHDLNPADLYLQNLNWSPLKIKKLGTMDTALEKEESPEFSLSPEPQASSSIGKESNPKLLSPFDPQSPSGGSMADALFQNNLGHQRRQSNVLLRKFEIRNQLANRRDSKMKAEAIIDMNSPNANPLSHLANSKHDLLKRATALYKQQIGSRRAKIKLTEASEVEKPTTLETDLSDNPKEIRLLATEENNEDAFVTTQNADYAYRLAQQSNPMTGQHSSSAMPSIEMEEKQAESQAQPMGQIQEHQLRRKVSINFKKRYLGKTTRE